ncbi:MAG: phage terminase small subunit P27 family [Parabacteroides sp.]|nr:phage terminase small subunit P27 family [Parabacteroides sp.]
MARPKEPIALIQAKGNKHLTKEEIAKRELEEIKAPSDNVTPPSILTKKQQDEFRRIADQLIDIKIMTNLDVDTLAQYVIAKDSYEKITRKLRGRSLTIEEMNKLSIMQKRYFDECSRRGSELGLTISSRCKLVVPDPKPIVSQKVNKFQKFEKKVGNG